MNADKSPRFSAPDRRVWIAEIGAVAYIALVALIAEITSVRYILIPELGALSHDILWRPHRAWAQAPLMLVITPFLTGLLGTIVERNLAFGLLSVLLAVGGAMLVIRLLKSPIAPAISAGLLPLSLGISSWLYAPALLIGLGSLAILSLIWRRFHPAAPTAPVLDTADDIVEHAPSEYSWVPVFVAIVIADTFLAQLTGWRLILFPPLVVISFEMFAHASICPWADRPLSLPIACTLSAAVGVILVRYVGDGFGAAALSMAFGVGLLRVFDLHVPAALAVGLLPFATSGLGFEFPASVGAGTLLTTMSFLVWRRTTQGSV